MTSIDFTPLTVADAPALSEVALRAYRDHYLDYWYDRGEWYMQHSFAIDQLATELADQNARYFMVNLDSKPVGFLKVNLDKPLPCSDLSGNGKGSPTVSQTDGFELERIYLVKTVTGHGVGQVAMNFVETMARKRGKQTLWLKAMDSSPALGFYKRLGFQQHGTHRLHFPQMKEDLRGMVILRKELD